MSAAVMAVADPTAPHDSLHAIVRAAAGAAPTWVWRVETAGPEDPWMHVTNNKPAPAQGWKLHVSATVATAPEVLRRALPVLLAEDAPFKVAASVDALHSLNEGRGGASQVGKFIAVYPRDDAQAVRLAAALDDATRGLAGPAVPSDRRLRPDSLVHYRYGGFTGELIQTPLGEVVPAIRTLDGALVPDRRDTVYRSPPGVADPFVAAGYARPRVTPRVLIAGRYIPLAMLLRSPRGSVSLALDSVTGERRVLKRARSGASASIDGADARDRLRQEAAVLRALGPDPRLPRVHELVERETEVVLVLDELAGETLQHCVEAGMAEGRLPSGERVVAWGIALTDLLAKIHGAGWVHGDLKAANTIVSPDGALALVDFEIACRLGGAGERRDGAGTRGYISPQQDAGAPPTASDDIYSLGALLYFAATGAEPAHAPGRFAILRRPVRRLNPAIGPALDAVIVRCLDGDPARRFRSAEEVKAALTAAADGTSASPPAIGAQRPAAPKSSRARYARLALRLGDSLCTAARARLEGEGATWLSTHATVEGLPYRDLGMGSAGALLALAEVAGVSQEARHAQATLAGARWLAGSRPIADPPLPGLYVGEAGVGAALLRAGQILGDRRIIAAAEECGRLVASLPNTSPDLYHGTAGRIRFHLLLWDETGEPEQLAAAVAGGDLLLARAEEAEGGLRWTIPPGYDGLSGQAYAGYAHGAAGIGDALLDLFAATGDDRYLAGALGAARWLERLAVPALTDGSGLTWPTTEGASPWAAMWCHGATGVGRFFLHLGRLGAAERALEIAEAAARATARGARWANPTQCHGLAGQIEFLLDMAQAAGDRAYLREALSLAALLEAFAEERAGSLVWPSERPTTFTPDYMVGYAGIVPCLLRLSDPKHRPHQLSRAGFRFADERAIARAHETT